MIKQFVKKVLIQIKKINVNIKLNIDTKLTTTIGRRIPFKEHEGALTSKFRKFKQSKLVITDRLHDMIFAAITGTSCIALDNLSGKVKGVFKWLKFNDYIVFCNNIDEVFKSIPEMLKKENNAYTLNKDYTTMFKRIIELI